MSDKDYIQEFVEKLNNLSSTELSRLRRSAGDPSTDPRIFDILARLERGIPCYYQRQKLDLCAVLYAICYQCPQTSQEKFNIGTALKYEELSEQRLKAILDTDAENLSFRLRQVFKFLNSKRRALNWEEICKHIFSWDNDKKWVQRKWAEGYFAPTLNEELQENQYVN